MKESMISESQYDDKQKMSTGLGESMVFLSEYDEKPEIQI